MPLQHACRKTYPTCRPKWCLIPLSAKTPKVSWEDSESVSSQTLVGLHWCCVVRNPLCCEEEQFFFTPLSDDLALSLQLCIIAVQLVDIQQAALFPEARAPHALSDNKHQQDFIPRKSNDLDHRTHPDVSEKKEMYTLFSTKRMKEKCVNEWRWGRIKSI